MTEKRTGARKNGEARVLLAVTPDAPPRCDYDMALHPHDLGHDVRLHGTELQLPAGATLTIGYAAGTDCYRPWEAAR